MKISVKASHYFNSKEWKDVAQGYAEDYLETSAEAQEIADRFGLYAELIEAGQADSLYRFSGDVGALFEAHRAGYFRNGGNTGFVITTPGICEWWDY